LPILHRSIQAVNARQLAILAPTATRSCRASASADHRAWPQGALPLYNAGMYIIVIGWLYVTVLMALTESSVVAGILSLTFYGLLPTALLIWLFGGPTRRRAARMARQANETNAANAANGFRETKQPHDR